MIQLPQLLKDRFRSNFGEEADAFLASFDTQEMTSIRLNPKKISECPYPSDQIPWEENGYILHERPSFIHDPLWHAGAYYVQESSSMFIGQMLRQAGLDKTPVTVLDACAAPGGKSTHLLSCLHQDSLVIANEVIPKRNKILAENIVRWGAANMMITQADTRNLSSLTNYFDLIVIDAPCSGEGMMRRDPKVASEWSEKVVSNCAVRQTNILNDLIPSLKPGGYLFYSTCTYEESENQAQVKYLLNNGFLPVEKVRFSSAPAEATMIEIKSSTKTVQAYRFDLHKTTGSGFFCCLLQKEILAGDIPGSIPDFKQPKFSFSLRQKYVMNWIKDAGNYAEAVIGEKVLALPAHLAGHMAEISSLLRATSAGVQVGQLKNGIFTPAHPLALSGILHPDIPRLEISKQDAITYLRKDTLSLDNSPVPGWVLLTYKGLGLGWVKIIRDGRINNYLPADWRIIKQL